MVKRENEIDVKLLLFALQKTTQFEDLLAQRYYVINIKRIFQLIELSFDRFQIYGRISG